MPVAELERLAIWQSPVLTSRRGISDDAKQDGATIVPWYTLLMFTIGVIGFHISGI